MELVNISTPVHVYQMKYYLSHIPVLTPSKMTTKACIVFDAYSKTRNSVNSLNDCLYRGSVILPGLCGLAILIRLRLYPIVLLADTEKAFLWEGIQKNDRDTYDAFLMLKSHITFVMYLSVYSHFT